MIINYKSKEPDGSVHDLTTDLAHKDRKRIIKLKVFLSNINGGLGFVLNPTLIQN